MNKSKPTSALNSTVIKLGLVSLFADIASEMLYPITPIFLTAVLGASMANLGLIEGLAEGIASLLKTYSGAWSDAITKRKPFVLVGYFLSAIAKPGIGFAQSWTHVLLARSIDRVGKGVRSAPRDALIADTVSAQNRGAAFGWHRGMDTLGAAIGPLIALAILSRTTYAAESLRSLYYWALVPGIISVLIVFFVTEPKHQSRPSPFQNPLKQWRHLDTRFKSYVAAWGVFSLTNSSDIFLLMKIKSAGASTASVILIYCFYNLIYSLSSPWLGGLSDKLGRKTILISGLSVFVMVYLGFSFASQLWHFWLLFAIYGLYMGATDGVSKALAVDLVPAQLRATGVGILGTVTGVSTVFASLFAGLIWDHFGSNWTFVYGAAGAAIAAVWLAQQTSKGVTWES